MSKNKIFRGANIIQMYSNVVVIIIIKDPQRGGNTVKYRAKNHNVSGLHRT